MTQGNRPQPKLQMTFTPNTIEHLGVRMYSTLPPVISELIANAYDADATEVHIHLKDVGSKVITISDNGHGMTFDDINQKFLKIGRNRRSDEDTQNSPGGRKVIGKKGLGKLSFFGIAHEIEIQTTKDGKRNSFILKWETILSQDANSPDEQENYHPDITEYNVDSTDDSGTVVILKSIQRTSDFDSESLANSIAKMFIIDPDFNIYVKHNNKKEIPIENERKYSNLVAQVKWKVPSEIDLETEYSKHGEITGHLIATKKPISPNTNMRGITLFSRKKLVNAPEYFSDSTSSHFFSYLTGWLEVDFIDDLPEDVIETNRQSLNWDHPEMISLKKYLHGMLKWLERDWRKKRSKIRDKELERKTGLTIEDWRKHIPGKINTKLNPIVKALVEDSELSDKETTSSLKGLQDIIKPYPYFYWQNLYPTLHTLTFPYYKNEDYFTAVTQGVIKYIREIQKKSTSSLTDIDLIKFAFSPDQPARSATRISPELSVVKKFKRPNGTEFEELTKRNITNGHGLLAKAMWSAFRNPPSHESASDLRDSGLYTDQDCLDALGLLSHLFRRLDNSEPS